jgi:L-alanine-DL-glutamate epimerase-like enolase superfamily enzyme
VRLALERHVLRLATPLHTAHGVVRERELVQVELTDDEGVLGRGEAAPLPGYDGTSVERVWGALRTYADVLERAGAAGEDTPSRAKAGGRQRGARLLDVCRGAADVPQALAAVDMALWDMAGRRAGRPVCALLTDTPAAEVPVNATLAASDRAGVAEQAARAAEEGFACVKLKVGIGDDAGRVAAARAAAGPEMALRLDANGAWDVEQAVRTIAALEPAGLELVEEPAGGGIVAIREVRERVAARVAIDESAAEPGALGAGVADAVCLKVSRCGGISGLLAAAALVRATGGEVYVASTLDGPLGVAAALHAAAALASRGPLPPCGLATLGLFAGIDVELRPRGGCMRVPDLEGLGVEGLGG